MYLYVYAQSLNDALTEVTTVEGLKVGDTVIKPEFPDYATTAKGEILFILA